MKHAFFLFIALLLPVPAQAQGAMSFADGFDAGLTLPWLFPEQTIALVAAGLFLGQRRNASLPTIWPVFMVALGIGLTIPPTALSLLFLSLTLLSAAFVAALLIAIQWPTPLLVALFVAAFAGLVEGAASAPGAGNWGAAMGVAAGSAVRANLFFVTPFLIADWLSTDTRGPWATITLRVAGSWIAAIAVMMLALLLKEPA